MYPHLFDHSMPSISTSRFKTNATLVNHLSVHADFLFKCAQCEKAFRGKEALRKHMIFHSKVKPHVCDFCGKSFFENSALMVCNVYHIVKLISVAIRMCGTKIKKMYK